MRDRKIWMAYLAAGLILIMILSLCVLAPGENFHLSDESVTSMNTGWAVVGSDGGRTGIVLPADLDTEAGEECVIETKLDETFNKSMTLCVRSSLQTLRAELNGREIYSRTFAPSSFLRPPVASVWNLITIPAYSQGKTLTLVFCSPYASMSGAVNLIAYGNKSAVLFDLIRTYGPGALYSLLILFVGVILIGVTLVVRSAADRGLLYLGLFVISVSAWLLAESKMLQFLTGNQFLIGGGAYMALAIFPIPMLLYIRETVVEHGRAFYSGLAWAFAANLLACVVLQVTGAADFFETVPATHALIMLSMAVTVVSMGVEIVRYKNPTARRFSWSIGILLVFAVMEFSDFYSDNYANTSYFLRVGLALYILALCGESVTRLRHLIHKSKEAQFYERMAFEDILTGGKNRAAYDRDLQRAMSSRPPVGLRLVVMDLNGLKSINDRYGHVMGDRALRTSYECMKKSFGPLGECYRIGGDEFACILPECDYERYCEALRGMYASVAEANTQTEYEISLAVGCAVYNPAVDVTCQTFLARADQTMYCNKREAAPQPGHA